MTIEINKIKLPFFKRNKKENENKGETKKIRPVRKDMQTGEVDTPPEGFVGITDELWESIKRDIPGSLHHSGVTATDNRLFLNACLYKREKGIKWPYLPKYFGRWETAYFRYRRWHKIGQWEKLKDIFGEM